MANINSMGGESKYLAQADFPDPYIVTIQAFKKMNLAKEGQPEELKWLVKFEEMRKPMVLNKTNLKIAAKVFASDETDDWIGKEIIVYVDHGVTNLNGEIVGGLRFRGQEKAPVKVAANPQRQPEQRQQAPNAGVPKAPSPTGRGFDDMDDDIPF